MKQANKQIGAYARAAALTPERRKEIATNAVNKRWENVAKRDGYYPGTDLLETSDGNIAGAFIDVPKELLSEK